MYLSLGILTNWFDYNRFSFMCPKSKITIFLGNPSFVVLGKKPNDNKIFMIIHFLLPKLKLIYN